MTAAGGAGAPAGVATAMAAGNAELTHRDFTAIAAIMHEDARIALSEAKTTLVQSRLGRQIGRAHV